MNFDVIVIGGGHAGCEAAHAAAQIGCRTAMVTLNPERIGFMSCNPAMGGLAKGQLIREIDALGGLMGRITDRSAIQYRRLNASKGPAVRSSRAQCDKAIYAAEMQTFLRHVEDLTIVPGEVSHLEVSGGKVSGVLLSDGTRLGARAIVITSGTFLRAVMHTGFDQAQGGRLGDQAAIGLSGTLENLGFKLGRLKTGTPPRLHRKSIDFSRTEPQPGDAVPIPFSFYHRPKPFPYLPQVNCFITYTNERTHQIIEENFERSPMFTGVIQGLGPRYCPSIEDKVKRFRERDRHQLFLEPEGLTTDEIYVNGISTSLPRDVQEAFVRSIVGLERAEFVRYGYAVEYDCVDARQLTRTLESKDLSGLFFAGQINGTSGYEEAGAQGLIAGANAALGILGKEPLILSRGDAYIGVMVDDLVLKGADEPYRMFTSRAEYRLLLREDNADLRLAEHGWRAGLLSDALYQQVETKRRRIQESRELLKRQPILSGDATDHWFTGKGLRPLKERLPAETLLRRPEICWNDLFQLGVDPSFNDADIMEQVEIQVKYEGYIQRDLDLLEGVRKHDQLRIPSGMDFNSVPGLSTEIRGRFSQARPETIGQASRMVGVTPAAVATLMIYLRMQEHVRG